ncbi:AMP-binding protein [Actinomycetospora sp.]|uniref:AMP-binding protein n=1 Tax=Actinomycetospora sp. TaxID=1872135 RepID=UPI002F408534
MHASLDPDRPAVVMAASGATTTYGALDERSARLATWLRDAGLVVGDVVALVLPNDLRWGDVVWACWRSGLVLAAIDWHLGAGELAPLMEDAAPRCVITSAQLAPTVRAAVGHAGVDPRFLVVAADDGSDDDGSDDDGSDYDAAVEGTARDPALVETMGGRLLFSSGTTGRPKPFRDEPPGAHPTEVPVRNGVMMANLDFEPGACVYLSTGPAFHAAPIGFLQSVHQLGGTVVLMERFDAEGALAAIERHGVTHSQWVPTMFVRLLRLPEEVKRRYDLSTHRVAVHGAAPCPPEVKQAVMDWWGPIVYEYYGASEAYGRTSITPEEWLAHPGSVGRPAGGHVRIADESGRHVPVGTVGVVWFVREDAAEPRRASDGSADLAATGGWGSVGDLGRLDDDGYLYLSGRRGQTIISGGVNIYPREVEDLLALHPAVADVAVIGIPDDEFGERVLGVVAVADGVTPSDDLAASIVEDCRTRLAHHKCPRSIDFVDRVPRSDAGKVLVNDLLARYRSTSTASVGP